GEHEGNYETHFGPLWYAFRHRNSWFIVLYTDEGDPNTGQKSFSRPESQRMSPAQFSWLESTLEKTQGAENVFVFMHHPRWQERGYGDDWRRVHRTLAQSGNVRAVFAGHIHAMQYGGERDGIEYFTLAAVGGHLPEGAADAGFVDQYHVVTVRGSELHVVAIPVGAAIDPRTITSEVSYQALQLKRRFAPQSENVLALTPGGGARGRIDVSFENPTSFPISVDVRLQSGDSRWLLPSARSTPRIQPGQSVTLPFELIRGSGPLDDTVRLVDLAFTARLERDDGSEVTLAEQRRRVPIDPSAVQTSGAVFEGGGVLECSGEGSYVRVPADRIPLPADSPFTLETWFQAERYTSRQGLV
ncbi:MAG: metallophosphoesterase, partial [Planctomycetota bacterium]